MRARSFHTTARFAQLYIFCNALRIKLYDISWGGVQRHFLKFSCGCTQAHTDKIRAGSIQRH